MSGQLFIQFVKWSVHMYRMILALADYILCIFAHYFKQTTDPHYTLNNENYSKNNKRITLYVRAY